LICFKDKGTDRSTAQFYNLTTGDKELKLELGKWHPLAHLPLTNTFYTFSEFKEKAKDKKDDRSSSDNDSDADNGGATLRTLKSTFFKGLVNPKGGSTKKTMEELYKNLQVQEKKGKTSVFSRLMASAKPVKSDEASGAKFSESELPKVTKCLILNFLNSHSKQFYKSLVDAKADIKQYPELEKCDRERCEEHNCAKNKHDYGPRKCTWRGGCTEMCETRCYDCHEYKKKNFCPKHQQWENYLYKTKRETVPQPAHHVMLSIFRYPFVTYLTKNTFKELSLQLKTVAEQLGKGEQLPEIDLHCLRYTL
jgi:hypothetical protein